MNNNSNRRKKNNIEEKDISADNKVKKQQKTKRKADTVDMSTGIVDIEDTPDVATWNKRIHIKDDAAGIVDHTFRDAEEIQTTLVPVLASGIGKHLKKI